MNMKQTNEYVFLIILSIFQVTQKSTIHDVKQKFHKACKFIYNFEFILHSFSQIGSDLPIRISSIL